MAYDYINDGFKFFKSVWGDLLVIEFENYLACSEYAKREMITGFRIHWWGGTVLENGNFLDKNKVHSLSLSTPCIKDCSFVMRHPELENFSTGTGNDSFIQGLDFSDIPNVKSLAVNWHLSYKNFYELKGIKTLDFWHFSPISKNLEELRGMQNLEWLNLVLSKCQSLEGIENLSSLTYLCIGNNKNLIKFCKESSINIPLTELWVEQCKKLNFETIPFLNSLKTLRIVNNGKIPSLKFLLSRLPNLTNLVFVQTELLDGNLDYLLEHPTLEKVTIDYKKHYNMKEKDINALLAEKRGKK